MGSLLLLVALCVVMATVSFLAGALPLSMTLTPSQMRLISSIGVGVLVGTSLIVIIPEGIEAAAAPPTDTAMLLRTRTLVRRSPMTFGLATPRDVVEAFAPLSVASNTRPRDTMPRIEVRQSTAGARRQDDDDGDGGEGKDEQYPESGPFSPQDPSPDSDPELDGGSCSAPTGIPTFEIGLSMTLGFVLMLLIDRLPRHATESLRPAPETRHMSLDNLGAAGGALPADADADDDDELEAAGFLGPLAPSPRRARGLATTAGLVIHAAADGIALGASTAASAVDMRLGFVVFAAIMLHKAPAAFGLTAVLLRQGLSKRAARGHLVIFSLAAPVGALATWCLITLVGAGGGGGGSGRGEHMAGASGQWWTGMLLLFSGGTFLYVAMHAMQDEGAAHSHSHSFSHAHAHPHAHPHEIGMGGGLNGYADAGAGQQRKAGGPRMRDTIATMAGILLPLVTQLGHHH